MTVRHYFNRRAVFVLIGYFGLEDAGVLGVFSTQQAAKAIYPLLPWTECGELGDGDVEWEGYPEPTQEYATRLVIERHEVA